MEVEKYIPLIEKTYAEKFGVFKNMLLESNKKYNLTAVTDEKGVFYKHFLDSIAGESAFGRGARVAEIGSGGGFPSIPLKIVRDDLKFTLIESTGKKCAFLREVVEKLGMIDVDVVNIRAEDGAKDCGYREKFDAVCARAVARLNTLCEYCLPYVRVGGVFIAYKGDAEEELKEAENAVKILGGRVKEIIRYSLPEDYGNRTVVVIEKVRRTPAQYPRGQGRERRSPI